MNTTANYTRARTPRGKTPWSRPPSEFDFGRFRVHRDVNVQAGLPRRGVGTRTRLVVTDLIDDAQVVCELARAGAPFATELMRGIAGDLAGEPFTVHREEGPRLLRKDRIVTVTGAVELSVGYERPHTVIRANNCKGPILWTSSNGGLLADSATIREAAVVCALVVNGIHNCGSLTRFLHFL